MKAEGERGLDVRRLGEGLRSGMIDGEAIEMRVTGHVNVKRVLFRVSNHVLESI